MVRRCIFKIGQVIATNKMREMLPPISRGFLPRGPFTVTEITRTNHEGGGYIMFADAARKGVTISWFTMFSRFGAKGCHGSGVRPYHTSLRVIDPEQVKEWEARCEKHLNKKTRSKGKTKGSVTKPSRFKTVDEMDNEELNMNKRITTGNPKSYLTLSQFDGEGL